MLVDLPLDKIEINPYNPRFNFSGLSDLVSSLQTNGQLSPIRVRECPKRAGKYQLVFGHRRFMAAKKLDWKMIRAEVVSVSEEKMALESLIENLARKDLSDYEKGLMFDRMKNEFGISFAEIGRLVGFSRQHVANYAAMLNLFSPERLASNPELRESLFKISEHHARVLLSVTEETSRMDLTLRTVKDGLTVRDVANIVGRLRSWFPRTNQFQEEIGDVREEEPPIVGHGAVNEAELDVRSAEAQGGLFASKEDYGAIALVIRKVFDFASDRNYERYKRLHLFRNGFTMYSAFPPLERLQGKQALSREYEWCYEIAPRFHFKIQDLRIEALDPSAALSTFTVLCFDKRDPARPAMKMVATMVLRKRGKDWAIFHEHWTKMDLASSEIMNEGSRSLSES